MQGGASLVRDTMNLSITRARETRCSISPGPRETRPAIRTVSAHQGLKTACAWGGTETADCAAIDALSPALRPPSGAFPPRQQTMCVCYSPTIGRPVPAFRSFSAERLGWLRGTPRILARLCLSALPKPPSVLTELMKDRYVPERIAKPRKTQMCAKETKL